MKFLIKNAVLCLALASVAIAGDTSELRIIGFSKDGSHLAFEVSGVQDGSGIPYSEVYFIDVENNEFLTSPLKFRGREGYDHATLAALKQSAAAEVASQIQLFQIDQSEQGQTLVYHPLSDLTSDGCFVSFSAFPGIFPPPSHYKYHLYLEQKKTGDACFGLESKIFTLKLKQGNNVKILQQDTRLPASRGCAYQYRIERVVMFEKKLVVFLNVFRPGFEGPEIRHMVVTGTLSFE